MSVKEKIEMIVQGAIDKGTIAGANVLAVHKGQVLYQGSLGYADAEEKKPLQWDSIFRLFSMSKPVTSVATMILMEQGKIDLQDKVGKYIPEFDKMTYFDKEGNVRDCTQDLTILHLLNMTSGIPYANDYSPAGKGMAKLLDQVQREQDAGNAPNTLEICKRVANLPLAFEPGSMWEYGFSADILGGVVEAASGMRYSEFLKKYIFEPLEMVDTDFYVPEEKRDRFVKMYIDHGDGKFSPIGERHIGMEGYVGPQSFESGGAGLVSTMDDYSHFAQMLLNGGVYKGKRILGRKTVEMYRHNLLTPQQKEGYWDKDRGYGYGLLMRIMERPAAFGSNGSVGEFGWDGWTGPYVTVDQSEDFYMIYMMQKGNAGTTTEVRKIRNVCYGSME